MEQLELGDFPQRKGSAEVPLEKQGWNIAALHTFELAFIEVDDHALRMREQLMPEVVRLIHEKVQDYSDYWGELNLADHWVIFSLRLFLNIQLQLKRQ